MSGLEVFLIVLAVLAVLAGVIVAIYFILRHDNKKNNPPASSGGGTNAGSSGTSGLTNLSPAKSGPPKNQDFSISVNLNNKFKASVSSELGFTRSVYAYDISDQLSGQNPCASYAWQYKDVTRNNVNVPNAIEFQYTNPGKGILYPTDDPISVTVGGQTQTAKTLGIDNNDITTAKAIDASWIIQDSKICLQNKPNLCLFVEDTDVSGSFATMVLADSTNNNDKGFLWDIGPLPTPTNGGCTN